MNIQTNIFNEHFENNYMKSKVRSLSTPTDKTKNQEINRFDENTFIYNENNNNFGINRNFSDLNVSSKEENLFSKEIIKDCDSSLHSRGLLSSSKKNNTKSFLSIISNDTNHLNNLQIKKKVEAEKFKKKKADFGLQGLDLKIKDLTKKKEVQHDIDSSKIPISPIFHGDEDSSSSKINHSFSSEIHLKNNKNYIPKDKLLRPTQINNCQEDKNNRSFSLFVESNVNKVISNEPSPIVIINDDYNPSPRISVTSVHNSLFHGKHKDQIVEKPSPVEKILIGQTYFDHYCMSNNLIKENKLSNQLVSNSLKDQEKKSIPNNDISTNPPSMNFNQEGNRFDNKNISFPFNNQHNQYNILNNNYINHNNINLYNNPNQFGCNNIPVNNNPNFNQNYNQYPYNLENNRDINTNTFNQNYYQPYSRGINNINGISYNNNNQYIMNADYQQYPQMSKNNKHNMMYLHNNVNYNYSDLVGRDIFHNNNRMLNIDFNEMGNEELSNYCINLAKDQPGCRFLQKKLEDTPNLANDYIFHKIKSNIIDLINNQFGNYFIQKMFEFLNSDNIYETLLIISPFFHTLCINSHGTRVIQKLLEFIKTIQQKDKIIELIKPKVIQLVLDINGNHIIQKFISLYSDNEFIFERIMKNFNQIITDKHGCCVMQKCIEVADQFNREKIINSVVENTAMYISNQYANYVIQYIITLNDHGVNRKITEKFLPEIEILSRHKFSSNVIEKVFDYSDEYTKELILKSINNRIFLQCLLFDMYGNYVFQKALSVAKEPYYSNYIKSIIPVVENLKNVVSFGPKLFQKLVSTYPEIIGLLNKDRQLNNLSVNNPQFNCIENAYTPILNPQINLMDNRNTFIQINNPVNNNFPLMNNQQFLNNPNTFYQMRNNFESARKYM